MLAYLSYMQLCGVCVAYPRLCFRTTAYQRNLRINSICGTFVSLLWSICDVLEVFCGFPRVSEMPPMYVNVLALFSFFPESWIRFFLRTAPGCRSVFFQGYLHGSLCICLWRLTRGWGAFEDVFPSPSIFFLRS